MAKMFLLKKVESKLIIISILITALISLSDGQTSTLEVSKDQADDDETELEDVPMAEPVLGNQTTAVATVYDIFATDKDEKPTKGNKVVCLKNETYSSVEIVNSTRLTTILSVNPAVKSRSVESNCSLVFFYARWCPFSAKAAPHFNALSRVYPYLKTAAIDVTIHPSVNTYFGILSVPTIMLFHNGKLTAKFNDSNFSLAKYADFIAAFTDLEVAEKLNVTSQDFQGPLPSTQTREVDLYLYLAWVFIIICFLNYARKSRLFKIAIEFIRITWREAEAQHEHQE